MARLKKLLLLANQHITRFHKELAAKDEQLRVLLACYKHRPGSATALQPDLLGRRSRLLAALHTQGEQPRAAQGPIVSCGAGLAELTDSEAFPTPGAAAQ